MGQCLEPLWVALSAAISQIEAGLPAHVDTGSEQPSAAASILPPGAAQVHFVLSLKILLHTLVCGDMCCLLSRNFCCHVWHMRSSFAVNTENCLWLR